MRGLIRLWAVVAVLMAITPAVFSAEATNESTNATLTATNTYRIPPNVILETLIPIAPSARASVINSKNPIVYTAREGIVVPFGFSPTNINQLLIVSGTSDGDGSSLRAMRAFTNVALRLGWVVLAADGPNGKPSNDNPPWRWAMLSSALEHMHTAWPSSRKWPVACAGFSGGAKWSTIIAAILCQRGYKVVGVFMAGCNQDLASEAARLYFPASKFKQVPFFLSSGTEDVIATPAQHASVKQSMLENGFTKVRLETYKGGHYLEDSELRTALLWFFQEGARSDEPVPDEKSLSSDEKPAKKPAE